MHAPENVNDWKARAGYTITLADADVCTMAAVDTSAHSLLAVSDVNSNRINMFSTASKSSCLVTPDSHWYSMWSTSASPRWMIRMEMKLAFVYTRLRLLLLVFEHEVYCTSRIRALDAMTGDVVTKWNFNVSGLYCSCVASKGNLVGLVFDIHQYFRRRIEIYAVQDTDPPHWIAVAATEVLPPMWAPTHSQLQFGSAEFGGVFISDLDSNMYRGGDERVLYWDFEKKVGIGLLESDQSHSYG